MPRLALLFAFIVSTSAALASAEDFRIDSKVFADKQPNPVSQSTTLFRAGIVYDYLVDPKRVAVFDRPRQRFILLDPDRSIKTEVATDEVARFNTNLRAFAAANGTEFIKSMLEPNFQITEDTKSGELVLTGQSMTYRIETIKPTAVETVQQYREFSDWYVKLNSMVNPRSTPPFARLAVNDELAKRGLIAEKVQLTIPRQVATAGRGVSLRSQHHITWRLLQRDLDDIAETAQQLATFKAVPFNEYRDTPKN